MKRLLLLDGDIFAFQSASAVESEDDLGDGFIVLWSDYNEAYRRAKEHIERLKEQLKAELVFFCHTSSDNWRKDVLSTYKSNRKDVRKPIALARLKQELADNYNGFIRPRLEADDCMGILATWDGFYPEYQKVIVSEDKDMQTIPCWLFNPAKDSKPRQIKERDADRFFMAQSLAGDATDGYGGCPNVGLTTAYDALDKLSGWESYEHTFKSGKRKGETDTRWRQVELPDYWSVVVSHYLKAGLSEEAALQQARVARICRASDYNFKTKEVILWTP